jgi:hypothetical protein
MRGSSPCLTNEKVPLLQVSPASQGDDRAAFLAEFRTLRDRAALDYEELAARAHYPTEVLREAEIGPGLPGLPVLAAYVRACGADVIEWEERWRRLASSTGNDAGLPVRPAGASPAAVAGARAGITITPAEAHDSERIRAALRAHREREEHASRDGLTYLDSGRNGDSGRDGAVSASAASGADGASGAGGAVSAGWASVFANGHHRAGHGGTGYGLDSLSEGVTQPYPAGVAADEATLPEDAAPASAAGTAPTSSSASSTAASSSSASGTAASGTAASGTGPMADAGPTADAAASAGPKPPAETSVYGGSPSWAFSPPRAPASHASPSHASSARASSSRTSAFGPQDNAGFPTSDATAQSRASAISSPAAKPAPAATGRRSDQAGHAGRATVFSGHVGLLAVLVLVIVIACIALIALS